MKGLAYWRIQEGLTQKELADLVNLSVRTISKYESDVEAFRKANLNKAFEICKVLNIELDDLEGLYEL